MPGLVYLLHFSAPVGHARHYLGFVEGGVPALRRRLADHRKGCAAKLTAAAVRNGISLELVKVWRWDAETRKRPTRFTERRLKREKSATRHCRHCRAAKLERDRTLARERHNGRTERLGVPWALSPEERLARLEEAAASGDVANVPGYPDTYDHPGVFDDIPF